MMADKTIVGRRILTLRKAAKLSQQQLARMIGCSLQNIGYYERGEKFPSLPTAYKIAHALGITLDQLVTPEKVVIEI